MKKILAWVLLTALVLGTFGMVANAAGKLGDADGNGEVSSADAALILRYLVELDNIPEANRANADANENDKIDAGDAAAILRYLVELDTLPPSGAIVTPKPTPTTTPVVPVVTPVPGDGYEGITALAVVSAESTLSMRKGPSIYYELVTTLGKDTKLELYHYENGWYYALVVGTKTEGYVNASYIKLTNERLAYTGVASGSPTTIYSNSACTTVVTTVPVNTSIGIIRSEGSAYKVRTLNGATEGYIKSSQLVKGDAVDAGVEPLPTIPKADGGFSLAGYSVTAVGVVNAGELYVRKGADTETARLCSIFRNEKVYALEKLKNDKTGDEWLHVIANNKGEKVEGYVALKYISFPNGRINRTVHVREGSALRATPQNSAVLLLSFAVETNVGVLEMGTEYWKVATLDGEFTGYVYRDYLVGGTEESKDYDFTPALGGTPVVTPIPNPLSGVKAEGIANSDVKVWSEPSASSTSLGTVKTNAGLYIFDLVEDAAVPGQYWYKVQIMGYDVVGYIVKDYVDLTKAYIQYYAYPVPASGTTYINLRAASSTSSEKLAKLYPADGLGVVGYVKENDGDIWYKVRVLATGVEGYVLEEETDLPFSSTDFDETAPLPPAEGTWEGVEKIGTAKRELAARTGAGVSNPVHSTLVIGTTVYIYDQVKGSDGETWYKVKLNTSDTGYCYVQAAYINITVRFVIHPTPSSPDGYINLREATSTSSEKIARLYVGDKLGVTNCIVEEDGDIWYAVTVLGTTKSGYVEAPHTSMPAIYGISAKALTEGGTVKLYAKADSGDAVIMNLTTGTQLGVMGWSVDMTDGSLMFRVVELTTGSVGYISGGESSVGATAVAKTISGVKVKLYRRADSGSTVVATLDAGTAVGVIEKVYVNSVVTYYKVCVLLTGDVGYLRAEDLA